MRLATTIAAAVSITVAAPANACLEEPLPNAMVFDEPPASLGAYAQSAHFELLEWDEQWAIVQLKADLFDAKAGETIRFYAAWNSCLIRSERWGDDFGAVARYRRPDGTIVFVLMEYRYEKRGIWPFDSVTAVGPPGTLMLNDWQAVQ